MFCGFRSSTTVQSYQQLQIKPTHQTWYQSNLTATKGAPMHWNKTSECVPSLPHGLRHQESGDCRQQLCVKCCFSDHSYQQMKFGTIHRANVLHSTDSKTVREAADIHISVNSSAKVVFLFLPKIFMILLGHVMHYTGRGWHQEIFFIAPFSLLLCPWEIVS